jgi:hypothetical protein
LGTFLASAQSQTTTQTASNLFYNSTNTLKNTTTKRLSGSRDTKGKKGSSGNLSKYVSTTATQHNYPKQMDTNSSRSKSKSKDLTLSSDTSNKSLIKTVSNHKPQDVTVTSQYSVSDPNIMMAAYSKSSRQVV